ncbi:MAG: NAD/NADP octopine/nopaline dehydrogenase family protein [Oscillospiraceae bacterium]|nr:NAD/NADP octopine/nopaline dehydrogenase family protein [Oscillospiraceae bacterium]
MNITIVGAGNIGTQLAAHCGEIGHEVTIFCSKPQNVSNTLTIVNEHDEIIHRGLIKKATDDKTEAFSKADVIFVTWPANMMKKCASIIEPFVIPGMKICLIPGTGGGECAFINCINKGAVVFGVQRVPSVARLVEPGKTVRAVGYRDEMFVAAIPHSYTEDCCEIIGRILGIRTTALPNYLNITLTPSNPILHTTRLRNLYSDYHEGVVYKNIPLFYEEWNNATSELLLACDSEVQELCKNLKDFDLSYVKSLRIHYESDTAEAMTKKISSITGFKGLTSPALKVEGGYIPDFDSRYFISDFSYGLAILMQIAEFVEMDAPNMQSTLDWYYGLVEKQNEFKYSDYGINSYSDFLEFYLK